MNPNQYGLAHPIWSTQEAQHIAQTHVKPEGIRDWIGYGMVKGLKMNVNLISRFKPGQMTERQYLTHFLLLESIGNLPAMIGSGIRHMKSIMKMKHDAVWIDQLMEENGNERMHLFTWLDIRRPGILFRTGLLLKQMIVSIILTVTYLLSPRVGHRFGAYLEETAIESYTAAINDIDAGKLPEWKNMRAPETAIKYWQLPEDAVMRDMLVAIRADEALHREVHHHLATSPMTDQIVKTEINILTDKPITGEAIKEGDVGKTG